MVNVSVIIPVYNVEKYLDECIQSVLNQTYKDFELILIDDNSTDKSREIINKYSLSDDRIKTIFNDTTRGGGGGRNIGIAASQGNLLCFLDSDDYYMQDFLEKMLLAYNNSNADIILSYFYNLSYSDLFIDKLNFNYGFEPLRTFSKDIIPKYLFNVVSYPIWNRLYKKSFIDKHNLLFEEVIIGDDGYFNTLSTFLANKIELVTEPLLVHRLRNDSNFSSCNEYNYNQTERILVQFEALKSYEASSEIIQSLTNLWLENAYFHRNMSYMKKKCSYVKVFSEIKKYLKFYPKGYIYNKKVAKFMFKLKILPPVILWYIEKFNLKKGQFKSKLKNIFRITTP